jgi:hypothetical protein
MDRTRRKFMLSSIGVGGALVCGNAFAGVREPGGPAALSSRTKSITVDVHEDSEFSCFEANLTRCSAGGVIATFGRAPAGSETGDILAIRSEDGVTWRNLEPTRLFSRDQGGGTNYGHQLASITFLADGTLIAFSTKFRFLFEGKVGWRRGSEMDGVYVSRSSDGGRNWGDAQRVDISPYRIGWTRGAAVEMPDGGLLLPLSGQKGDRYSETDEPISTFLMRSVDGGLHWRFHSTLAADTRGGPDYDEPAMVSLGGGRLLCVLRSHQNPSRDPLGGYLYTTISDDGGLNWSRPQKSSMWGNPANVIRLQDGRILCTYGYRMHPDPGVRGSVSADGVEWKPEETFIVKALPDVASDRMQIGCPSSVQLADGRILTAYQVWAKSEKREGDSGARQERQCLEASVYRI